MLHRLPFLLACLAVSAAPAAASSTPWLKSDGGAIRIVTSGLSDEDGALRGALEIDLKPGWKTYWQAPGEAGVPPEINLAPTSDTRHVELLFPAPERISDAYAIWAGYQHPVTLPVVFDFPQAEMAGIVEGTLFLGICETICVPVEIPFSFDAGADPDNPADAITVEAAFAALPDVARADFGVSTASRTESQIEFHVTLPDEPGAPALFVVPPKHVQITMPELRKRQGKTAIFTSQALGEAAALKGPLEIGYTLVAGEKAVAGQIALP
ncbi:protein-disulfide reductase DsbD domain-containing protein [Chelativorans sp. J32]|uniref:protein-disulfide reductase DsbD domain-containing protein n=1 Tax=Chelativorans sp. J32 TaxID=935840 RepID=UPI0004893850|nr:protein-disulfide reductase DsbD domain-containing protein [Chelativorans sp. J32]